MSNEKCNEGRGVFWGAGEGAGVGDAARGDVAVVRHLATAGDDEIVQEAPLVAEGGEGGELGVVVEAEVAEEGARTTEPFFCSIRLLSFLRRGESGRAGRRGGGF